MAETLTIGAGRFLLGDCLERMSEIPDASIDMILADLPYGTTSCAWDTIIPFEPLWRHYWRVAKPNAAVVLTASQPFTTALIMSQIHRFKYEWIWEKSRSSGFVHAKNKPLKIHENICVFSIGAMAHIGQSSNRMPYFPQMEQGKPYIKRNSILKDTPTSMGKRPSHAPYVSVNDGKRFPLTIVKIDNPNNANIHPTQKPVALFEYMIRTYTEAGAIVLDNVAGSGTTAIAAERVGRRWICIEREPSYYYGACGRIWSELHGS